MFRIKQEKSLCSSSSFLSLCNSFHRIRIGIILFSINGLLYLRPSDRLKRFIVKMTLKRLHVMRRCWGRGFKSHPVHIFLLYNYGIKLGSFSVIVRQIKTAFASKTKTKGRRSNAHRRHTQRLVTERLKYWKLYCFWYAEEIEGEKKKLVRKKDTARKEKRNWLFIRLVFSVLSSKDHERSIVPLKHWTLDYGVGTQRLLLAVVME